MELDDLFSQTCKLPSIPKVVQELIQQIGDDTIDMHDIARKIGMDQVLTAKVLRLANSAYYGRSRNVASVNEALVRLGFKQVRTLVLASSFTSAFKAPSGFDIKAFWRTSFNVAEISRWLAGFTDTVETETAFTCGMVSHIGRLMTHISLTEIALEIDRVVAKGGDRGDLEYSAWGFTSDDAGAKVAEYWKFPLAIVSGVKYQSDPWKCENNNYLACIIFVATYISTGLNDGIGDEDLIISFPNDVARNVGIDLSEVLSRIAEVRDLDSGIYEILN